MAGAERGRDPRDHRDHRDHRDPHPGSGVRLLLLLLGGLAALGTAQVTSEDKEVPEHKPVEIPCAAFRSSGSNPRIEWKFQKGTSLVLIFYEGKLTESYQDRVQFSRTSIRFQSVTREDSGRYICEVVGDGNHITKSEVNLIVQVPPGKPLAHVPSSATVGSRAVLRCSEAQGSPPPTFRWYKDGTELPLDPKSSPAFRNSSYSLDPRSGELVFEPVGGWDTGDYHCEASNNVGTPQKSDVFRMEASEVNVGGIVAAVVLLLLVLALAGFGIWFAHRRGYFGSEKSRCRRQEGDLQPALAAQRGRVQANLLVPGVTWRSLRPPDTFSRFPQFRRDFGCGFCKASPGAFAATAASATWGGPRVPTSSPPAFVPSLCPPLSPLVPSIVPFLGPPLSSLVLHCHPFLVPSLSPFVLPVPFVPPTLSPLLCPPLSPPCPPFVPLLSPLCPQGLWKGTGLVPPGGDTCPTGPSGPPVLGGWGRVLEINLCPLPGLVTLGGDTGDIGGDTGGVSGNIEGGHWGVSGDIEGTLVDPWGH